MERESIRSDREGSTSAAPFAALGRNAAVVMSKVGAKAVQAGACAALLLHAACASRIPVPKRTEGRSDSYVAVPLPPPPLRPEHVPPKPNGDAVWVDGEWDWDGARYRWTNGAWVDPPSGARIAPWAVVRRDDGQLFFSPSVWYDERGSAIPQPPSLAEGRVREADAGLAPTPSAEEAK